MSATNNNVSTDGSNETTTRAEATNPELDVKKLKELPSEQQDLYLLTFVSKFTAHVESLAPDDCTAQQVYLKKELLQILNLPAPPPTRVIRNNIGRCFAHILGKGDRKLLFESFNDLIAIINNGKIKDADLRTKHAAVYCLGDVFAAAGDSAIGFHPLACSSLLKLAKGAVNNTGLRAATYVALSKTIRKVAGSMDEAITKDVWKSARSAATGDNSTLVQVEACRCLKMCVKQTPYFDYSSDFDSLKSSMWRTMDSPSVAVRQAAADCLSEALVKAHSEDVIQEAELPRIRKPKKVNTKRQSMANDDEEVQRPSSPALKRSQLQLSIVDMLRHLSVQYVKTSSSNRLRAGIAACYCKVLQKLRPRIVETTYLKIVDHLTVEVLSHSTVTSNRYRLLSTRRYVQIILEDIVGHNILGEAGQIHAAKWLINDILRNYPQALKERSEPTKQALIASLSALASLIKKLGSAANTFAESCRDGLLQILQHPNYTVQIYTSYCLRTFTLACPQQLLSCLNVCTNSVNRELSHLASGRNVYRRCQGYANGLAAMISTANMQPLYGSVDINSRVLSLATNLLKSSSKSELRISSTQIQVAWILIGGLMSLGPNFVKIHLSQLLLLWKNALPKPLAKDNTAQRSYVESSFLAHVRECALGSILAFLQFNSRLLTVDVSKRIASMLQNTIAFLKTLPLKKTTEDISQRLTPSLQLQDLLLLVQRRVLQCYAKLVNFSPAGSGEVLLQANLLPLAISFFADPDNYTPSSLSTSIANSAGHFETIWDVCDNCGFGVTGLVRGFAVNGLAIEEKNKGQDDWTGEAGPDSSISRVLLSPVCSSLEHDSLSLYLYFPCADPPATEVVNVAISLFAVAFPLTPARIQESILEQVATFLSAGSLQRDPGRKAAMEVNIATALYATMKVAAKETSSPAGDLTNAAVERLIQDLLRTFVLHPDQYVRNIGYEALARLCNSSVNALTNQEIKFLIDTIVINREPHIRAGCAMALGCIHAQVGGMAAGFHLKTILGILMSLCNDPHPTVHYWSLEALARVADSAGLTFSGYVSSTLGMIGQLYVADTHNEDVISSGTSNLELELPTTSALARCVDSLINVLGPDLQDISKARELILTLVSQFQKEENVVVVRGGLRCLEHFVLYAPGHMNFTDYVVLLQKYLNSDHSELQDLAIDGLYNLMKRDSEDVIRAADAGFEDQLWLALDLLPSHEGIRNVIRNWLQQSCVKDTSRWLQRCQAVLTMTRPISTDPATPAAKGPSMPDLQDEEVAGFAAASGTATGGETAAASTGQEPLRWQVRTFAMSCLAEMFALISEGSASESVSPAEMALQKRIADIIRMAFSASTSNVVELRVWGLKIIDAILKMFGRTPDPDFAEAPLLEQYQAQISSALTPAFAADSSPELASEAVNVCAAFISTGIVKDVDRMGRILKTLVTALENFSTGSEVTTIGDLKGLSSNAQVMVKMSVFSAWAELQVASSEQQYLIDVLKPYIGILTPLWLASLREFARLRFEPDITMSLGPPSLSGSLDTIYAALNRETLLRFYQDSWLNLVDAIASLIEQDSELVFDALDGKETDGSTINGNMKGNDINYRDEPVAFFFVLFGIAFEALIARPGNEALATKEQTLEILQALKKILHPSVSGHAIYREAIFSETMDLLDRLVLTEGLDVQSAIVQIARDLCIHHPSATKAEDADYSDLNDDIEQLFELTRIIVLVLAGLLPNLTEAGSTSKYQLTDEAVILIRTALTALVDAAAVFPTVIKTDLHACIFHIFATILGTSSCQTVIAPQSLPILKRFVISISSAQHDRDSEREGSIAQVQGCLTRFMSIYANGQKRESEASLPCVKNTLLAMTILLSSGQNALSSSEAVVIRLLDELVDCLSDRMTAKVASNCVRTLLLQSPKSHADQTIARHLLPLLVNFVTTTSTEDPESARSSVCHTLTAYVPTLKGQQKAIALSVFVPTLLMRANGDGEAIYKEISARLLELAASDQIGFKGVVAGLTIEQRSFMEELLLAGRQAGHSNGLSTNEEEVQEPTIALRMDFGS